MKKLIQKHLNYKDLLNHNSNFLGHLVTDLGGFLQYCLETEHCQISYDEQGDVIEAQIFPYYLEQGIEIRECLSNEEDKERDKEIEAAKALLKFMEENNVEFIKYY